MFRSQGLFASLRCPDAGACQRDPCPFSHKPHEELPKRVSAVDVLMPKARAPVKLSSRAPVASTSTSSGHTEPHPSQALKRGSQTISSPSAGESSQPPRKIQKLIPITSTGAPSLQVNPAQSKVAVSDRQKLLTAMYDQFRTLYKSILVLDPGLPARHALAQEQDIYDKSSRLTYRNAMIQAMGSIKKRPHPDKIAHHSVGTIAELSERTEKLSSLSEFKLLSSHLEPLILSRDDMVMWEYVVDAPPGPGGDRPSEVGNAVKCERCNSQFIVTKTPRTDECTYHWGRAYGTKVNGVRETIHKCCSMPSGSTGCQKGPHVFYEKLVTSLHSRHPFTTSSSTCVTENGEGVLDMCAMDCEMVYTTAGMSVARVSAVDGKGEEVFDHLVRMSDGVDVLDFNTRFSGITSLEAAVLDLEQLRKAIGAFIGPNTIIIGHALENDLKTLRMIHGRVVDTAALYKHKSGAPYRRALRDLAREYLGITIQTGGGTTGHSSVEDARATLDLVRCYVMEHPELHKHGAKS